MKPSATDDPAKSATITSATIVVVTNRNNSLRRLLFGATMASLLLAVLVYALIFGDGESNGQSANWKNMEKEYNNGIFSYVEQSSARSFNEENRLKRTPKMEMDFSHQV